MTILKTMQLTLRPCTPMDRADFIELELDPEVMRFLNNGAVDHEKIDPANAPFLMPRGEESNVWTARRNTDDQFAGWFCLSPEGKAAEIGYRFRRKFWGQGLASEGALALVKWGFEVAGYEKIIACTMAVNLGSRRVMEKIGMQHTRTDFLDFPDPIPGTEHGEVTYELTRSKYGE
ncbi:GNAT family N-acetyltransferase [Agrobacterium rhizogenes]|nr:GNAT family N-acetyltransferase [Rhizobium rhizogenes]NTJ32142.1 GNAT family N-acetyltransferase [Rhizobium rhizogenes]